MAAGAKGLGRMRWRPLQAALLLAGFVLVAAACGMGDGLLAGVAGGKKGTSPPAAVPTPPGMLPAARVVRVVDGDTIEVEMAGRRFTVRYIGIDTPETVDPRRAVMCYGKEAARRNAELVEGKTVLLEKDVSETDRYGRLLRYVWVDGKMVNAVLVEEGYARAYTVPPDVRYADLFRRLEREARAQHRGLWGACPAFGSPA